MADRTREDELRPVTVLFADVVGSTSLGEGLTPDEVKVLVGECVSMMSRAVEEYGGMVQAYAGDGICAYFGVPAAHEDDPERAARAGLRILEVVREYARDVEAAWGLADFSVRVGINTGQAAVGQVGAAEPACGSPRRRDQRRRTAAVTRRPWDDPRRRSRHAPSDPPLRLRAGRRAHDERPNGPGRSVPSCGSEGTRAGYRCDADRGPRRRAGSSPERLR